jgi:non-heme chloroperoxidase
MLALDMPPPPPPAICRPAPSKVTFMSSRIALPTGVELDVIQSGDLNGVPVLLLHGISDSAPSMRPFMENLPRGVRAIAISQRGHGDSSKPAGPYTTAAFVADAAAVLDHLRVRRAVVLGHSMGSVVAQRFAIDHPDRTLGLVLEGAFPTLKGNPDVAAFYEAEVAPMQGFMPAEQARGFQESTLGRPVTPAFLQLVVAESQKLPARAWKAILTGMMSEDFTPELRRVAAPTLLLWGDKDGFARAEDQQRLLAAIPGSRMVTFEGTGHDPHWEEPERAARVVGEFVLTHCAATARAAP